MDTSYVEIAMETDTSNTILIKKDVRPATEMVITNVLIAMAMAPLTAPIAMAMAPFLIQIIQIKTAKTVMEPEMLIKPSQSIVVPVKVEVQFQNNIL